MKKIIGTIHLEFKDDHNDSLDLIELRSCKEKCCERSEYCIRCANCNISHKKLLKRYCRNKLYYTQLQTVDFKIHFKKTCFNCSCSFHVSNYVESHLNLQKMFKVAQNCIACRRIVTTKRSFYHNCNVCNAPFKNCRLLVQHRESKHASKKPFQCPICHQSLSNGTALKYHILYKHELPHKCPYCSKRYATILHSTFHRQHSRDSSSEMEGAEVIQITEVQLPSTSSPNQDEFEGIADAEQYDSDSTVLEKNKRKLTDSTAELPSPQLLEVVDEEEIEITEEILPSTSKQYDELVEVYVVDATSDSDATAELLEVDEEVYDARPELREGQHYRCRYPNCIYSSYRSDSRNRHELSHQENKYKGKVCQQLFTRPDTLRRHFLKKHT